MNNKNSYRFSYCCYFLLQKSEQKKNVIIGRKIRCMMIWFIGTEVYYYMICSLLYMNFYNFFLSCCFCFVFRHYPLIYCSLCALNAIYIVPPNIHNVHTRIFTIYKLRKLHKMMWKTMETKIE